MFRSRVGIFNDTREVSFATFQNDLRKRLPLKQMKECRKNTEQMAPQKMFEEECTSAAEGTLIGLD